jgi:glycosyltransferase involved in cell wall biosynthesis
VVTLVRACPAFALTTANFQEWAVVAHKDDTGFGRQAADCRAVLGIGWHFVIPSERLTNHPVDGISEHWLPVQANDEQVRGLLSRVKGILFFERPDWHPRLLPLAREMGVATICVPNWEWFRATDPRWQYCDLFACPSVFTKDILARHGYHNTVLVPWALDLAKFPSRIIKGPARLFVHNAGIIDRDDRKGTQATLRAFSRVKDPTLRLIVRLQKPVPLPTRDPRVELQIGNTPDVADLYRAGDACIQPSKMEGIGFMVLEPVVCGIPVITTDHAPMNEYVRHRELRCRLRWFRRRAYATQWVPHAHLRLPSERDLAQRIAWCSQHDLARFSQENRRWAQDAFSPVEICRAWTHVIAAALHSSRSCSRLS